jgi:hypothetical protein
MGALHLKALLHRVVIAEILATKPRRIARTCGLLLLRTRVLRQRTPAGDE